MASEVPYSRSLWLPGYHIQDHKMVHRWENNQKRAALSKLPIPCKILKIILKIIYVFLETIARSCNKFCLDLDGTIYGPRYGT